MLWWVELGCGLIALSWVLILLQVVGNKLVLRRVAIAEPPADSPLVSVVIPARDEERSIERTVRAFLAQSWSEIEVIVVDDRSTDETARIVAAIDDPRLHLVTGTEPPEGWLGKPWALQQGGEKAQGEWLLFCDADVLWLREALASVMARAMRDERDGIDAWTVLPHLETGSTAERVLLVNLVFSLWTLFPFWRRSSFRSPRFAIGGGPGNLMRRSIWREAGGHASIHNAVVDDIGFMRHLRSLGLSTGAIRADHLVEVRMYHGSGEVIRGFEKNAWYAMGASFAGTALALFVTFTFNLLPYFFLVAGPLGLISGLATALSAVSVLSITAIRLLVLLPGGYGVLNALVGHPFMMGGWLWIIARSAWATGLRGRLVWRGRSFPHDVATPFGTAYDARHDRESSD